MIIIIIINNSLLILHNSKYSHQLLLSLLHTWDSILDEQIQDVFHIGLALWPMTQITEYSNVRRWGDTYTFGTETVHEASERKGFLKSLWICQHLLLDLAKMQPTSHEHLSWGNAGPRLWPESPMGTQSVVGAEDMPLWFGRKSKKTETRRGEKSEHSRDPINLDCIQLF